VHTLNEFIPIILLLLKNLNVFLGVTRGNGWKSWKHIYTQPEILADRRGSRGVASEGEESIDRLKVPCESKEKTSKHGQWSYAEL